MYGSFFFRYFHEKLAFLSKTCHFLFMFHVFSCSNMFFFVIFEHFCPKLRAKPQIFMFFHATNYKNALI